MSSSAEVTPGLLLSLLSARLALGRASILACGVLSPVERKKLVLCYPPDAPGLTYSGVVADNYTSHTEDNSVVKRVKESGDFRETIV